VASNRTINGQKLSPTPLKLYSIAGSIVFLIMLAYERYIWRGELFADLPEFPSLPEPGADP